MDDHIIVDKADLRAVEQDAHIRGWRYGTLCGLVAGAYLGMLAALLAYRLGLA